MSTTGLLRPVIAGTLDAVGTGVDVLRTQFEVIDINLYCLKPGLLCRLYARTVRFHSSLLWPSLVQ